MPTISERATISRLLDILYNYQKEHNIKGKCVINSEIFQNLVRELTNCDVKVKAYFVISNLVEHTIITTRHLAVVVDGIRIEPSYELYLRHEVATYFDNYMDFKKALGVCNKYCSNPVNLNVKEVLTDFIDFSNYAESMNRNVSLITIETQYEYDIFKFISKFLKPTPRIQSLLDAYILKS